MTTIKYYWEDFIPGWQYESPPKTLTAQEIVTFAREYDPQSYHTDEEAAKASPFGGLIASGWQTCGVAMRLMCDGYLLETSCIGSPGLDELRWFKPVRPGDALRLHSTVLDQAGSQKDPTRGTVQFRWDVLNQKDEVVCSMTGRQHFRRRIPAVVHLKKDPLATDQIRFDDGAAYERYMGKWSQLAGETFLDWLAPQSEMQWLDVGCGNGAFTEMLVQRCAPASVDGIDPSEGQLAFARTRAGSRGARFDLGDAMALPFSDDKFDVAVMPLVIFFVPDPARGVAEMARVVRPGGTVAAYAWDIMGAGFPYHALQAEMRGLGVAVLLPPSPEASQTDVMRNLWAGAGLAAVETREITVQRTFGGFEDYWATILGGASVGSKLAAMASEDLALLKSRMRARLPADSGGRITCSARANAVKGRVPN